VRTSAGVAAGLIAEVDGQLAVIVVAGVEMTGN
jgi:hypothetical protein